MKIDIKLDKDFERFIEQMKEKYGERMVELNGLSESQLNHTEFIDNFVDKCGNTADASIDANANIGHKDVTTLENEMMKPHLKLLALNKIFFELKKKYGLAQAKKWAEDEWSGASYLHDAYSSTLKSYCYKGENLLTVKYNDKVYTISFNELYKMVDEPEQFDDSIQQEAKFPENLFVLDLVNNELCFTKVNRIVVHYNDKALRVIKLSNGLSQIVTEDHPIITSRGNIPAKEVTTSDFVTTVNTSFKFTNSVTEIVTTKSSRYQLKSIFGTIPLTAELGWFVGFLLAEASISKQQIFFKQNKGPILDKVLEIAAKYNILLLKQEARSTEKLEEYAVGSGVIAKWIKDTFGGQKAVSKHLPTDFIHYNFEFLDGIVAGFIDGDGTLSGIYKRTCQIRITSEQLFRQFSEYLQARGIKVGDRCPYRFQYHSSFKTVFPIFGITFSLVDNYFRDIQSIKVQTLFKPRKRQGDFNNKQYTSGYGEVRVISNTIYLDPVEQVYDITTETGHFICNNILSHNCFAYDLKPIVEKGLFFVTNFNAQPPQHLITFTDFVGEAVSWLSNRSSGAVGLPNFLVYSYYFWKKDCKNHYYTVSPEYYRDQEFQRIIYKLNQPYLRVIQSAFTNFSIFDRYYVEALFGGLIFPDGTMMIDEVDEFIEYQKAFMKKVSEIRSQNMMTFPVLTYALLRVDGKFMDEEFARWCCKHNMTWADSNFFISEDVTSLSNCCRLVSNIDNLGYFNSIGGTALEVGSVKVNTINLARIAYETKDKEKYLEKLKERVLTCVKTLDVVRHIIQRNIDKGLLPNYSLGLVHLKSQYSTVGICALWECIKYLGGTEVDEFGKARYTSEGLAFAQEILKVITDTKNQFIAEGKLDYQINIEQVPAERCATILQEKDKQLFEDGCYDLPLYGNQWIPLGVKTSLYNKLSCSKDLDIACSGGSIAHINLESPFTNFDMAWDLLNKIADMEVPYFAFCTRISACKNNHGFYGDICPTCGEKKVTSYQRIVGFLTPEINYSKERKAEFKLRDWFTLNQMEDL